MESIADWGNEAVNAHKIEAAYSQQGGWEGWVQVELTLVVQKHFGGAEATISREQYVYNGTQQRCDILIETNKQNGEHFVNLFEIKCESSGSADKFRTEVNKDCTKIDAGVSKFYPCEWWIVAFGVTRDIGDLKAKGVNLMKYYRDIKTENGSVTIWMENGDLVVPERLQRTGKKRRAPKDAEGSNRPQKKSDRASTSSRHSTTGGNHGKKLKKTGAKLKRRKQVVLSEDEGDDEDADDMGDGDGDDDDDDEVTVTRDWQAGDDEGEEGPDVDIDDGTFDNAWGSDFWGFNDGGDIDQQRDSDELEESDELDSGDE
ncbi:hypothetical protein F5050DRAFT_1905436 [Lentinula boryana]|uniref:Protein NO VEIN C-terminal domain-containing protein n=1 Tax=Lentinula boryana TaxID=40481 RepID=A0ABQ8Q346_9AGAR|nr:hypothetical protein F5050DRAFT_1905436 [Lentinula boryana]